MTNHIRGNVQNNHCQNKVDYREKLCFESDILRGQECCSMFQANEVVSIKHEWRQQTEEEHCTSVLRATRFQLQYFVNAHQSCRDQYKMWHATAIYLYKSILSIRFNSVIAEAGVI